MNSLDAELASRLDRLSSAGLRRELRRVDSGPGREIRLGNRWFVNFAANDYLGFARHPAVIEAAARAVHEFGAGSGASRLMSGSLAPHHELETALAEWKATPAALTFGSGYATALGVIPALVGRDDVVAIDKRVHASCVDAARLSEATLRVFRHNDLNDLERILKWTRGRPDSARQRILVVTESVFSMDGDHSPLAELVELKDRFDAWLMLDEAHATGLFGPRRTGLAEAVGVAERIDVQMGTLGKALGAAGGYVCGSAVLIDYLVNRARSLIYSTAPVPAAVAAAREAIRLVQSDEGEVRCAATWQRIREAGAVLNAAGFEVPPATSAILPLIVGAEDQAVALASALRDQGIFVPAIRFPTVARGQARLRFTVTADHREADLDRLKGALKSCRTTAQPTDQPTPS